jgi:phage terminase large subunit
MTSNYNFSVVLPNGQPFMMYEPYPKQREFHASSTTNFLAYGNRAGGKSLMLRFDAHSRALSHPGLNLILIRKTYKDLLKSHVFFQGMPWGSLKREMELIGGTFHATDYICHYPNDSKLFLSYVGHESDALNLLSAEFAAAYFDEISTIPWEFFLKLQASVRVTRNLSDRGIKAVIRAASNPYGESAGQMMQYFVNQDVDPAEDPDYDPTEWGSLRIGMEDNPHIDLQQYHKRFAGLPPVLKKAWLYGEYSDEHQLFDFHATKNGQPYHVIDSLPFAGDRRILEEYYE